MSVESFMVEPVTIIHPGTGNNRYGEAVATWDNATETNTTAWLVQQNSNEPGQGTRTNEVVSDWIMAIRGNVDISSKDRVRYNGNTYEIVGDPRVAKTMVNLRHHQEINLRIVKG
jgi:SPP1 family predicted phage head-tail adaptor